MDGYALTAAGLSNDFQILERVLTRHTCTAAFADKPAKAAVVNEWTIMGIFERKKNEENAAKNEASRCTQQTDGLPEQDE